MNGMRAAKGERPRVTVVGRHDVTERLGFLRGGGEAARLILERDWTGHVLGPPDGWPAGLKTGLSLVLNSPESMILAWGPELSFFFNEAYLPLLGPRVSWAMGERFDKVWADGWLQAKPIIDAAYAGRPERFTDLPWQLATDRGSADTWWTFSYSRVLDEAGEVAGLLIFTNETTREVLGAAALRESKERLRLIIESAKDHAILTTDPEGIITSWSAGAEAVLGWSAEEIVGRHFKMIFTPEDQGAGAPTLELETAARNQIASDERWHLTKDGERVFLNGSVHPFSTDSEGHERGFIKIARDETERKQAAEALQASEFVARQNIQRVQLALAAGAIIGTWFWDIPTDRFTIDEGFARAFGLDPALGREGIPLAQIVATVHPDDQQGLAEAIDAAVARGGSYAHQYRVLHADGEYHWIEANGRVDSGPDGRPKSFPGVLLDIDERRAVEEERDRATAELRVLTATLETRVAERTAELLQAEEALRQSQKMEAVGQLTGGVAHDFNNLLTILRSSIDFLRRPELPEARRARYLDAASETVERAAKLTGQLLAFARRQALKPEVFDVGARLRSIGDMLDTVTGAPVQVSLDVPQEACPIRADVSQFETALVNMAVNARDAMADGGRLTLQLRCGVAMPSIRGHAGAVGPFVAVSVSDTGVGIAADHLAQIFEPFFTTKEIGKGTGLGLSQVFGFAKQSGGDVDVASIEGEGSTFTLYLPEERAGGAEPVEPSADASSPRGEGQRVLVVEDNLDVGRFSTQILDDLGYVTEWVTDAETALQRLGDDGVGFDVVFSDVVMPGMGGVALAETLRERLPRLPVVLTSGYSHVLASDAGHGFELLHKPYSADQLARILQRVSAKA